ncbi:DUF3291 domain-containing protein [Rhodovulum sp. DZ06]|uniref:DUF3291 domain-containing protein n=1 Tax=Rhodovulum sp. DZ06 TaxID=3425126 RepID=UPI003D336296
MAYVAQLNMGYLLHPFGDPRVAGFVDAVEAVNALAERSPGFVWRMSDRDLQRRGNTPGAFFGRPDRAIATVSVWESDAALAEFVLRGVHGQFLSRRAEWFEKLDAASYVLWPVEDRHRPGLAEGKAKLLELRENGPSAAAYDLGWAQARAG